MTDLINNYPRVFLYLGSALVLGFCGFVLYTFGKKTGEDTSFSTYICTSLICVICICFIWLMKEGYLNSTGHTAHQGEMHSDSAEIHPENQNPIIFMEEQNR